MKSVVHHESALIAGSFCVNNLCRAEENLQLYIPNFGYMCYNAKWIVMLAGICPQKQHSS